ncbi:autotransporter-associated beta strand repeat-containing protein [Achromobacter sp. Marseille-Q4954]|uniref:autotransporter-associated beta strand repeat-containing protein n=1 Tax=Achromobacter sp. Marseille-Q4954 TaxID=2942203 RepID=UPI0020744AAD|nr:autotransporter-associated beta strand repeat-containing protein [Achromobacter sp. Marseille-Q4954]
MSFRLSSAFLIALGAFPAYSQTIDGGSIVTVPGSQSSPWNLGASSLTVGNTSTGTLQIGATGVVSNGSGFIGRQVGSTGHVTVSGTGAQWTNSAGLSVGFSGTGTLGVSNGGVVRSTTNTYVGVAAGGTGTVTVSGLGSQLNTTGFMRVGQTGNGTLQISDSAVVSNAAAVVGYDPGSVGVVTVSGAGTQWNSSAQLSVGASGNGAVTISNDAVVSATSAVVGGAASSQGVINIGAAALAAAAAPGTLSLTGPSPSLTLGATGGLVFNHTNTAGYVFTPGITGAGKLSTYNGTTILTANNNYTGGTTIAGGTLQLGNGGTSGAIVGNVANNGILNFNRTDSVTFAGLISGSGVVNQNGTGATILTANNTYTGGTAIAAGTLQLGNGGTTGAIVGNVANNGALVFDRSNTLTFAGQISGSGSVSQIGAGTTVLTADSTYTGGTTISAGTLQLGSGGTSGAILGNVVDNGALTFNRSDVQTFAGQISGGGVVNQIGTGTTILTADNTYTGGTTISAGTLQLGNGGTTGAIPGDVTNNGALTFNRSDVQTFPGLISGSGTVNQIGSGTTTLTADNTYTGGTTIAAGTLQLGNGGTSGAILGDVANSGALSFNRSDAVTFAGLISGSGTVNQNGTGTTILTAQNTYGGPTNVNNGVLRAGAASTLSPNSAVNVAAAGTLDLSGYNQTVAGVTNAGLINMGTGTAPGTTLTTPNYAGQGGRIAMNTLLGDDSSPSDRLVINGGTASGSSSLIVTNAGGAGAVTTGNGILLVDAVNGGTTATSAFTLGNAGGYVAAGPYAYTLQRSSVDGSGLQNWYLRSTVDCAAAPSNPACKDSGAPRARPRRAASTCTA